MTNLVSGKNIFSVKYIKNNNYKGARSFTVYTNTFEDVLFNFCLNELTNKVFGTDYWYEMLGVNVIVRKKKMIDPICVYSVKFKDIKNNLMAEYLVDMECIYNSKEVNILEEEVDLSIKNIPKQPKEKQFAKWLVQESYGVRNFLILLEKERNLVNLKYSYSKSSFYRLRKKCIDNGYIKDGKLVKKLWD